MNCNREVVILKNIKSDYIEEAILILKDSSTKDRSRALKEAEKIVFEYGKRFDGVRQPVYRRQKKGFAWLPFIAALGLFSSTALLLLKLI